MEPSAPQTLQATAGTLKVTLNWQAPISDGNSPITNYRIYRGTTSGGETYLTEVGNVLSYTDLSVVATVPYYYKVSAKNAVGEGVKSNESTATPTRSWGGGKQKLPE